jgi:hypothetical protein
MRNKTRPADKRPTDMDLHLWMTTGDDAAIDRLHVWAFSAKTFEGNLDRIGWLMDDFESCWESADQSLKPCKKAFEYYSLLKVAEEICEREGWSMDFLEERRRDRL